MKKKVKNQKKKNTKTKSTKNEEHKDEENKKKDTVIINPKKYKGLTQPQIQEIWDFINEYLGEMRIDFNENNLHIIYEVLLIANDFFQLNYIWHISDEGKAEKEKKFRKKAIETLLSLVFRVLHMLSLQCKDYFISSKIREKNIQIEKNDNFEVALKSSFYESSGTINQYIQRKKFPSSIAIIREMDEVICRILIYYNKLRNKTLILNFMTYLHENVETQSRFKDQKETIYPGKNFVLNEHVLPPLEDFCKKIQIQENASDGLKTFVDEVEKFTKEMIKEDKEKGREQ